MTVACGLRKLYFVRKKHRQRQGLIMSLLWKALKRNWDMGHF